MSDLRRGPFRAVAAVLALVLLAAPSLAAQRHTQYDALRDYWAARSTTAAGRLKEFRRIVDSANTDTVHARYMDLVTTPQLKATASESARLADSIARNTWLPLHDGQRAQFELRLVPATRQTDVDGTPTGVAEKAKLALFLREEDRSAKAMTSSDSTTAAIDAARMAVRARVVEPSLLMLDTDLRQWMAQMPAAEKPTDADFHRLWLELATFPSLPARGCLVGELHACRTALALTVDSNPVLTWYDPAMRQTLVARWLGSYRFDSYTDPTGEKEAQAADARACVESHADASCIRFLRDRRLGASVIQPGPLGLRMLLVRFAFSFPADSVARERAAFAPGLTIDQRLSLASGRSFDMLLREFQSRLAERRPGPHAPTPLLLWTTTAWCVAFGALSMRSTRWR